MVYRGQKIHKQVVYYLEEDMLQNGQIFQVYLQLEEVLPAVMQLLLLQAMELIGLQFQKHFPLIAE